MYVPSTKSKNRSMPCFLHVEDKLLPRPATTSIFTTHITIIGLLGPLQLAEVYSAHDSLSDCHVMVSCVTLMSEQFWYNSTFIYSDIHTFMFSYVNCST